MMAVAIITFISATRDIPTVIFLSTHNSRTLSLLMLDYIADANKEKSAVLGVFLVLLIFALLLIGGAAMRPFDLLVFPRVQLTDAEKAARYERLILAMPMGAELARKALETP